MPTSDKDIDAQRNRVDKLRAQLAAEQAKANETVVDLHNDVVLAQLQAEEARLQAELDVVKDESSKKALREGAQFTIDQHKQTMADAVARQKAADEERANAEKRAAAEKEAAKTEASAPTTGEDK